MPSLFRNLWFFRSQRSSFRQLPRSQPALEKLEDRCLPAAPPPIPPLLLPAVTVGLTAKQIDRADAVINWNATMLRAIWTAGTPPTLTSRVEAMVAVAVYDAVDAIHPTFEFYAVPGLKGKPTHDASPEAAAIAAADTVLNSVYPDQKAMFDAEYKASLGAIHGGKPKTDGIAWGQTVANAVLAWRSGDDLRTIDPSYVPAPPGGIPGVYELTPQAGLEAKGTEPLPALTPQWGQVTPWAMTSGAQFLPAPTGALWAAHWRRSSTRGPSWRATAATMDTAASTRKPAPTCLLTC